MPNGEAQNTATSRHRRCRSCEAEVLKEGFEWGRLQGQRATRRRKWRKGYAEGTEEMLRDSWNTAVGTGKELEGLGEGKTQWLWQRCVYTNPRDLRNG